MTTRQTNVLAYTDQTVFLAEQATGSTNLIQCVWVYDRALDEAGLRRFHRNLQRGWLSRRVERSAIPFGRHRWVSGPSEIEGTPELEIAPARPRSGLETWLTEQSRTPLDCEAGPGWHLAMLPLTDGATALSLVISHCLADGVGLCTALAEAASGPGTGAAWPRAGSRARWAAVREDLTQTARDLPAVGRALRAAVVMARQGRGGTKPAAAAVPDEPVTLPTATAFIDADEWDSAVERLGGTGNALLAGIAAELGRRMGRVDPADGTVSLSLPVSDRADGDTRANAVTDITVVVDPKPAPSDLRGIRAAIKAALIERNDVPDERWAILPLIPLIPKRVFRRMVAVATGDDRAIISSNLGEVDSAANRPDGTDADYFVVRSLYPDITRSTLDRAGGVLALASGRVRGRVFISVLGYLPGQRNSEDGLRRTVALTLEDFALTSSTPWPAAQPAPKA